MKPINSVAVAMLLSLGIVACSGNGSSNAAENHAAPTPPAINENGNTEQAGSTEWIKNAIDNPDYIHLNATNETIVLQNINDKKTIPTTYSDILLEYPPSKSIEIGGRPKSGKHLDTNHVALDATYTGKLYFADKTQKNKIKIRPVIFKLQGQHISGHSVKNIEDDLQVIFEKTAINKQKLAEQGKIVDVLGFNANFKATKEKKDFDKGGYLGYFAGPKAEEVVGELRGTEHIDGAFVAEKQAIPLTKP
ncbi:hypothetical protein [Pasteurella sp. PK-2025]|uniref:hypothetical protein n=1 Tax=Pasteurella sp. PK-2025 TaxID=3413133 RepID=UPI003C76D1BC